MRIKVGIAISALMLSMSALTVCAQNQASRWEDFKREMLPQVGQKITVTGVLEGAKFGWAVIFKDWAIYIYPTSNSDIRKMNELNHLYHSTVQVTGTLQYFPEPPHQEGNVAVAIPPEHFYFDVAETTVISLSPPRSKRPKKSRGRKTSMLKTPRKS